MISEKALISLSPFCWPVRERSDEVESDLSDTASLLLQPKIRVEDSSRIDSSLSKFVIIKYRLVRDILDGVTVEVVKKSILNVKNWKNNALENYDFKQIWA